MSKTRTMRNHLSIEQLHEMIVAGEISASELSPAQLRLWAEWEPDPIALSGFALSDPVHREEFLYQYYWQGETALFAAVAHVWGSLAEPREARCTLMGLMSSAGGKGKTGLVLTLQKFLAECLGASEPLPDRADYDSLDAWHRDSIASFGQDEERARSLCKSYSVILDGGILAPEPVASVTVIMGPWRQP